MRAHLEELFMVGGVDVIIEAHEHSYEVSEAPWGGACGVSSAALTERGRLCMSPAVVAGVQ